MHKLGIFALANPISFLATMAFDNKAGWKLDADGKIEMKDGNPVFINAEGAEMTVDSMTISRVNGENKTLRERAEAAERTVKAFEGIDPAAAKKAIETVGKIDAKTLIDAGEVDKVKDEISKGFAAQLAEKDKKIADQDTRINSMTMNGAFASSKFVSDRVAVPAEMFQATFADRFKIEDGKIVPYDQTGSKVYSKKRVGEVADFDEALEILVDNYPHKDSILKAPDASGTGNGGGGGARGGGRFMSRADFDKLTPAQQAESAGKMRAGELTISD